VLFDTKGLPDAHDGPTNKLLGRILRGKFRANHSMNNPKWYDAHLIPQSALRPDVIVFVHAFGSAFAWRLAGAVAKQAQALGLAVVPVITYYDMVQRVEDLDKDVELCAKVFNAPPFCIANLGPLRERVADASELRAKEAYSHETVVDLVSQALLFGQQNHRARGLPLDRPVARCGPDCRVM